MKIGINATFLNETPTGTGVFTREISHSIFMLHKEIIIFSPLTCGKIPLDYISRVPEAMKGSSRLLNNIYRFFYINSFLLSLCKFNRVDILYCPITEFPFIPLVPIVVHIHDLHPIHFPSQFGLAAHRMRFSLKIIDRIVKRIIVPSEFIKRDLLQLTTIREDKIDVIPNAYNKKMFKPQGSEMKKTFFQKYSINGNYILFVGTLFPYKNIKTLINTFLKIKDQIPHCLVVVGMKEFSSEPLQTGERILYMDYVPAEDLPMFYSFADLFVYPSLREGFGIAALEAMACGTPVLVSNAGSLPEVVGDAGILFDPKDSQSLAQSILSVIQDERLRSELIKKGFQRVERFSWDKTALSILQSCKKALEKKK